jgi:hypothetical protein
MKECDVYRYAIVPIELTLVKLYYQRQCYLSVLLPILPVPVQIYLLSFFRLSSALLGKCRNSEANQAMVASFHTLSKSIVFFLFGL